MARIPRQYSGYDQRILTIAALVLAAAVFCITWYTIRVSRNDSFDLLVEQGRAFTESLADASQNAITSEAFYERLVRQRYADLVITLTDMDVGKLTRQDWASFALTHDLLGVYLYAPDSGLIAGVTVRGARVSPPPHVEAEVDTLFSDPEARFVLMLEEGDSPDQMVHYYLELTSQLDRVLVFASDAAWYTRALQETGISRLARRMAREPGIEYIVFQTASGPVFSSSGAEGLSDFDGDEFLVRALDADSIVQRIYEIQGRRVLELIRPFSVPVYPPGLFRVGLSLDRYYAVSRGFDQQLIILSGVLVVLLLVAVAYIRSRRKRYEMEVEYERQAQRRERLSEMGNLAAGVAHEIRNPLNTISIAAQRLAREFEPTANREQYQAFAGQIRTETGRLNEIITRFLALAKDERRLGIVELEPLIRQVETLLRIEGDGLNIAVTFACQPGLRVDGDADRFKEMFINLFNNSKEALAGRPGRFEVLVERAGRDIRISVSDDGPGIAPEMREKVFAPYYTSKESGTGLGLATVQRIVTDCGGEIRIDETYSAGARFVITLPPVE